MLLWFEEVRSISKIEFGSNFPKNDRVIPMEKDSIYSKFYQSIKNHRVTPIEKGSFWPKIDQKS